MTVTPKISINDGDLVVHGKTILTGVPDNIVLTPGSGVGLVAGTFIGATACESKSIHVFPMGTLESVLLSLTELPSFGRKSTIFICFVESKLQGFEVHVLVQIQAMVDDAEDGDLREAHPAGDPIHAHREQARR